MRRNHLLTATAITVISLISLPAYAQDSSNVSSRIGKLEEEIRLLKRQQEVTEEINQSKAEKQGSVEIGKKGLAITSPDKEFSLKIRGYTQVDGRLFVDDESNTGKDDILARRIRPVIEGTAFKDFSYRLMADFAGSSTRIFDAHIDYKYADPLSIRVGKFKPAIGLERLQSATDLFFIERGHPTNLAPSRDFGVQFSGDLIPETLEYQVGVFNGNADLGNTDSDDDDKKDLVARVFAHPFRQSDAVALRGFGVGIAGSVGDREGSPSKTILGDYRSPGQQAFFKYRSGSAAADTAFANGEHRRIYPQAYYYYNNFGLLGEYVVSSQDITRGTTSDTLDHKAWQVAASYVLTGEDVNFKGGVKPEQNFSPEDGTWGAFEVVARVGETDIDDDAFPVFADITKSASEARSYGTGLNWHLNENVKLAVDYDYTSFEGGAAGGADRPEEQAIFSRAQFRF